jgi:WD40 repeat protein
LSAAYDRYIKLWDTETGKVISRFSNKKVPYCVKFNPEEEKQHLFVAGMADKKIVCVSIFQIFSKELELIRLLNFSGTLVLARLFRSMIATWVLLTPSRSSMRTGVSCRHQMTKVFVFGNGKSSSRVYKRIFIHVR